MSDFHVFGVKDYALIYSGGKVVISVDRYNVVKNCIISKLGTKISDNDDKYILKFSRVRQN